MAGEQGPGRSQNRIYEATAMAKGDKYKPIHWAVDLHPLRYRMEDNADYPLNENIPT
jgi:hypothetical protein